MTLNPKHRLKLIVVLSTVTSASLLCAASSTEAVKPFSFDMVVSVLGSAQTLEPFSRVIIARRSDGVTVEFRSAVPHHLEWSERKISLTDGNQITLYDQLRLKSTWPLQNADEMRDYSQTLMPHSDCNVSFKHLGNTTLFGQTVIVVQHTIPGRYRVTQWLAPEFGCEQLQYESESINSDGSFTLTGKGTVSKFIAGEPDPKLFDPGSTFAEVKPSDAHKRLLSGMGIEPSVEDKIAVRREDAEADRRYHMGDLTKPRWGGVIPAR